MSVASVITLGYGSFSTINAIVTLGYLPESVTINTSSGVRRLSMSELQNHPQVIHAKYLKEMKIRNEEEELLMLLASMVSEYFE